MPTATNPDVSLLSDIRLNVLVLAPEKSPFADWLRADPEHEFEVHHVVTADDGWRLLGRGKVAVLVIDGSAKQDGLLQLLVEALNLARKPVTLVVSVEGSSGKGLWKRMREASASTLLRAVKGCCEEYVSRANPDTVTPKDFLLTIGSFPEDAWIRITCQQEAGDLCLRDGKAVYCEVGPLSGIEGVAKILNWGLARFEYRQLPSFLPQNVDSPLLELLSGNPMSAAPAAAPEVPKTAEVPKTGEDPTPEPAASEPATQPEAAQRAEPGMDALDPSWLVEPEELPTFSNANEEYGAIDEPADMPAFESQPHGNAFASEMGSFDLESPEPPDFEFDSVHGQRESRTSSLIASVAVLAEGSGGLESCEPPADSAYFDPATLRALYEHARQYAQRHKLGLQKAVILFCGNSSIAITPIPGSQRLLAVRLTGREYGEAEQNEVRRLQEQALLAGDPVGI